MLTNLGGALQRNHRDKWLSDFLRLPHSPKADALLKAAINDNLTGKSDEALATARLAARLFGHLGNSQGTFRSRLEEIYALRRKSRAHDCSARFSLLAPRLDRSNYAWLRIRLQLEAASCASMANDFDHAWHLAQEAANNAERFHYPSLQLRALGYLGSFHTSEGRLRQSWQINEAGLATFWSNPFGEDRGYQFYADLAFAAEQAQQWHLAAALQREATAQIDLGKRLDFQAMAHCRLARMQEFLGNIQSATDQFHISQSQFGRLPKRDATYLYEADCQVARGGLEARYGTVDSAAQILSAAEPTVAHADNFTIHLHFEKAWADLEHRRGRVQEEKQRLQNAIVIGNQSLGSFRSASDRWAWHSVMEQSYRRLLELELIDTHNPELALSDWESFRSLKMPDSLILTDKAAQTFHAPALLRSRLKDLHKSTILVFAIFPHWLTAWVADDRGVHEYRLNLESQHLEMIAQDFFRICSTPDSPLEKVKSTGFRLYQLLVAPLAQELDPKRTLFIEADRGLSMVPWPALVQGDQTYMGQTFEIVSTPGLFYRQRHLAKKGAMKRLLIAYPGAVELDNRWYSPLPHAEEEAEHIRRLYPDNIYLKNEQATVESLLEYLPGVSIFHFGGHAITREHNGELIVRRKGGGDILSSSRLTKLVLFRTELVVLSACSTGGESEPARDPDGLVETFLAAGARRVVASHWAIDSRRTAELMENFYDSLHGDTNVEGAMKNARNQSSIESQLPYYWAAFQVFGALN